MGKDFKGFNHRKGQISIDPKYNLTQLKPVEIHLKEDGDLNNEPSFAIIMVRPTNNGAFGQISLKMLNEGLADIGYKIEKIK